MRTFKAVWWRHAVAAAGRRRSLCARSLFVVSAALNPLGTLNTAEIYPTGASLNNFTNLFGDPDHSFGRWFLNSIFIALAASFASVFLGVWRLTPSAACGSAAGGWACSRCC